MSRLDAAGDTADLIEHYFEQGWTDGLPVVPPTPQLVAAMVAALGGIRTTSKRASRRAGAI